MGKMFLFMVESYFLFFVGDLSIFEVQKTPGICTSILGQTPCRTMVASMKTGKSRIKIGGFHGKLI